MIAAGLQIGYANYQTETEILDNAGIKFQHYEHVDDIQDPAEISAIMVRQYPVDASLMDRFPNLKIIQRYGVGVDNVDLNAAKERNIKVCNTPDYGQYHEVSDHALALYLAVARRITTRDLDVKSGRWGIDQAEPIYGHRHATLGLIGYGKIAQGVWQRFKALGFAKCLISDPAISENQAIAAGVQIASHDEIFAQSDVISLHCPLLASTHHIIDHRALNAMKSSAYLINVSRGGLIDEDALANALGEGRIAGAAMDVFEHEPADTAHPLFKAPNTVLTDHVAWYSEQSVIALQTAAAREVVRVLSQ